MVLEQTDASIKGFGKLSEFGKSVSNSMGNGEIPQCFVWCSLHFTD